MNKTMKTVGAVLTCCAGLAQASLAEARCTGPQNATFSSCNDGVLNGNASRSGTNASARLTTGRSALARQRDINGDRVFCGPGAVAPRDQVAGAGTSPGADQTDCTKPSGLGAVNVQVLVD